MFIKIAQRIWATKNLSFLDLNGPALITFSRKEYFHCTCTVFQVLLKEQIISGSSQCVLFGPHSATCNAPITLLMKSHTQMNLSSSPLVQVTFNYLTMLGRHYVINSILTSAKNPFGIYRMSCQDQGVLMDLKSTTYKG